MIRLQIVQSKQSISDFHRVIQLLYKDNVSYVFALKQDVEGIFDQKKNKLFQKKGEAQRWVIYNQNQQPLGRIAAFINPDTAYKETDQIIGSIGFFECVNDQAIANELFEVALKWLKQKKVTAIDGPINFGARDKWWGLLVDGFDLPPNYQSNYHLPYYKDLFERFGFQLYFKQYTFASSTSIKIDEQFAGKAKEILKNSDYSFENLKGKSLLRAANDFRSVYNKAWAQHIGVSEMSEQQALKIMRQLKPIIDKRIIWFGYFKGEAISFFVNIPEINQWFKYLKGDFGLFSKLKFLFYKTIYKPSKMLGLVFGVDPAFKGDGVVQAMVLTAHNDLKKMAYKTIEMNWVGDFNPRMIAMVKSMGEVEIVKTHHTYRYLLDRNAPFERMPISQKIELR